MQLILRNISHYIILLIGFLFPIFPKAIPPLIILYFLIWLINGDYKGVPNIKFKWVALLGIVFFLLHAIGLSYSDNLKLGLSELESKFSFLLIPMMLLSRPQNYLGKIRSIMASVMIGCFVGSIISLWGAFENYLELPELYQFMGGRLFSNVHLAYFSLYLNVCILFIFWLLNYGQLNDKKLRYVLVALGAFFAFMILLSTSKNGILTLLIDLIVIAWIYIKRTGKWSIVLAFTAAIVLFFTGMINKSKWAEDRFTELVENAFTNTNGQGSTGVRKIAWSATLDVALEHPLTGVGTGDVKQEIFKMYEKKGETDAFNRQIGPHNQYLQSFAELGILGLSCLVLILFYPLYLSIKKKSITIFLFVLAFAVACFSESILERQARIMFFNFFLPILLMHINHLKFNDSVLPTTLPS